MCYINRTTMSLIFANNGNQITLCHGYVKENTETNSLHMLDVCKFARTIAYKNYG